VLISRYFVCRHDIDAMMIDEGWIGPRTAGASPDLESLLLGVLD
jgi:hypothetical protein